MNEEERMIKYVEKIVEDSINNIEGKDYFEYIMTMNDIQAIQSLLNLYNKEKERNKDLEPIKKLNIPVETLVSEFNRLEDLEDNTEMLKSELEKKDKIIDKMAERLVEDKEWFYSEFDNYSKEQFKDYFTNLVEKEDK
jgi:hypothetical protein